MRFASLSAVTLLTLAVACGGPKADEPMTEEVSAEAPRGDEVRGVAQNAKGGAVLLCEDGRVVYISGLDAWPETALNKTVVATGKLEQSDYVPDPVVADDGAMSAGAEGLEWVLRDAEWKSL